jgi:hypothetical protein
MRQHHRLKANRATALFRQMHLAPETKDSCSVYFIPGEFVDLKQEYSHSQLVCTGVSNFERRSEK